MKKAAISTPEGTRDRVFAECAAMNASREAVAELFMKRGFSEIITPTLEYYELFLAAGTPLSEESMFKLIDRSGRLLVLRPDLTTPALRMASSKLAGFPIPHRLFYSQNVFRAGTSHSGRSAETVQSGAELIGASGRAADVEMIALAVDALKAAGLSDFRLEIGHADYFKALAAALPMEEGSFEQMRRLVESKNFAALNDLLEKYEEYPAAEAVKKLPQLFGGAEIFDEALSYYCGNGASDAIDYLRSLYDELSAAGYADNVTIDLGLVHSIQYYTGVVFRGYASGAGGTVLGGGRYDKLASSFGRDLPAIGFGIDMDAVCACLPLPECAETDTLVWYEPGFLSKALEYLDSGKPGTRKLAACDTLDEAVNEARTAGVNTLCVIGANGIEERSVSAL